MSFWQQGDPVSDVKIEAGRPIGFTWRGQKHPVRRVAKVWRVDDAWWVHRVWRDNFKLITTTGLLLILSHDLLTDAWQVLRLYD